MKELKIFAIVVVLSGILYWGIEPYAHTQLHTHTSEADFDFSVEDESYAKHVLEAKKAALEEAKKSKDDSRIEAAMHEVQVAQKSLDDYVSFWNGIKSIDFSKGDAKKGAQTFVDAGCTGCHGVEVIGVQAPMDHETASQSFGVVPPDLSTAGKIYDEHFLAALIKDPAMALKLTHKFNDERPFPMTPFYGAGGDINQELADIVAYMKSISEEFAKQHNGISDERLFYDACQRCHDLKYDKQYTLTNKVDLAAYVGSNPPDLSMMIRSKNSDNYLSKFINDTQKMLPGTAMPRVGLTEHSTDQIVNYLEKVGDSKKAERESTGLYIMVYFLILGIFATLWKRKVWKDLH